MIWKKELECYVKRKVALGENLRKAYLLVWGQYSDVMRERLEALPEFKAICDSDDVLGLLKHMKSINFKFEDQKYPFGSVYFANKRFYNYKQGSEDTNNQHYEKFNNLVSVVESYGGQIGHESILLKNDDEYQCLSEVEQADMDNLKAAIE